MTFDAIHIRESDADMRMREIAKAHLGHLWNELDYVECAMVLNGLKAAHDLGRRPPSRPKPHGREEMSDMIERVARAIYEGRNGPGAKPWASQPKVHRAFYLLDAHAAIEAMREPTEQMLSVEKPMCHLGDGPPNYTGGHNWLLKADKQMWQAMIDAALTGDTK